MKGFVRTVTVTVVMLVASLAPLAGAGIAAKGEGVRRPPLEVHQGQYFRWSIPRGWKGRESTNGVTLEPPGGTTSVQYAILLRSHGNMTPENFLTGMLRRIPGYGNIQLVSKKRLPDQPSGIPGTRWKVIEAQLSYTVHGRPVTAIWTSGINEYYGMYDAMLLGYHAGKGEWPQARTYLPEVARSIAITNTRQVAGNDALIPVRNNPLDNSGLIESWRQKGLSEDRISKARREGTSGYERVKDPQTGHVYEMPLEAYDGAAGGYRNPARPGEILKKTEPWE